MINLLIQDVASAADLRPGAPPTHAPASERGAAPSAQESISLEKTGSADSGETDIGFLRMSRSGRETGVIGVKAGFGRLISTRREAAAILARVPERERVQALDFEASRTTALRLELGEYRIVHFATHGMLNNIHPELSGIVLSLVDKEGRQQDGFLRLPDVYNLKYPA
jgi:CHAT domain-containing protein